MATKSETTKKKGNGRKARVAAAPKRGAAPEVSWSRRLGQEMAALLLLGLAGFFLLALGSHSPTDPQGLLAVGQAASVQNAAGKGGALVAAYCIWGLGLAAFWLPLMFLGLAWQSHHEGLEDLALLKRTSKSETRCPWVLAISTRSRTRTDRSPCAVSARAASPVAIGARPNTRCTTLHRNGWSCANASAVPSENLARTIEQPLTDPQALSLLPQAVRTDLERRSGAEGLRLWAMTQSLRTAFDAMQPGDDVLITGTGHFTHYGQVERDAIATERRPGEVGEHCLSSARGVEPYWGGHIHGIRERTRTATCSGAVGSILRPSSPLRRSPWCAVPGAWDRSTRDLGVRA